MHRKEAVSRNYGDVGLWVKKCLNREKNNEGQLVSDSRNCGGRDTDWAGIMWNSKAGRKGWLALRGSLSSLELFLP